MTGLATLGIGAGGAVVTIVTYLLSYRGAVAKGMLAAHALLPVGIAIMMAGVTHNA
ncbi:hypothetical protein IC235_07660 [Hymenobacter sp. BT664]|uniref:Uncharacterized protein n=1 Tax=Hymenobacter montanus TaxID=2771359 RepID=A0A927BBM7_9BACT|nr:hypothetical protein [Hymenobacter montanus]MBD2767766.1 hypothetical protein [Hymenobacter montanus]